ncbi:MAG: murein biosynthesis integral membrane protein MurJ [Trueperaceae bacterium]
MAAYTFTDGKCEDGAVDPAAPDPPTDARDRKPRRSSARGALTLMVGTLASRVTGLFRNSILTQFFPAAVSDAFLTAFRVPNLFRELLAEGALTNSFVPVYRRLQPEERRRLTGALLGLLALVNGLLMLLAYLSAPLLARLLIGDPDIVDVELTTRLIRIVFPFLPAISFSALAMGVLNAEERFLAPAWAPVMLNVVTVTMMALFPGQAVMLTLAHVLGGLGQLLIQLPALARYRLLPSVRGLWHPALGGVLLLMLPFTFTTSGRQMLNVLASNLVTGLFTGAQNAFVNADLFLSLMLGLFSISPALAYYSRLSAHAADEPESFAPTLVEGLRLIAFLTVPAGLGLSVLAAPAVQVAFNWRELLGGPLDDARLFGSIAATAPLGLAVFPIGMFNLLVRTFYIRRQIVTPVLVVLGTLVLQGALYLALVEPLGIAGLSWGAVIAAWAQLLVTVMLVSRMERLPLRELLDGVARVWLAALLAAAAVLLVLGSFGQEFFAAPAPFDSRSSGIVIGDGWLGAVATFAVGAAVFASVYGAAAWSLGVKEMRALVAMLIARLR